MYYGAPGESPLRHVSKNAGKKQRYHHPGGPSRLTNVQNKCMIVLFDNIVRLSKIGQIKKPGIRDRLFWLRATKSKNRRIKKAPTEPSETTGKPLVQMKRKEPSLSFPKRTVPIVSSLSFQAAKDGRIIRQKQKKHHRGDPWGALEGYKQWASKTLKITAMSIPPNTAANITAITAATITIIIRRRGRYPKMWLSSLSLW